MAETTNKKRQIQLELVTPERQVLNQAVESIVFPGAEGSFGVLPGHAAMVAALKPGILKLRNADQEIIYAIGGGYAEITGQKAMVLADTAEVADEIDMEKAQRQRDRALAQLKKGVQGTEMDQAEFSLQKALTRLRVLEIVKKRKS